MGEGEKEEEVKYLQYLSGSGIHADYSRQETFDRRLLRLIRGEARSSKGPDASMRASDPPLRGDKLCAACSQKRARP